MKKLLLLVLLSLFLALVMNLLLKYLMAIIYSCQCVKCMSKKYSIFVMLLGNILLRSNSVKHTIKHQ